MSIAENYRKLREDVPDHVTIVLAGKTRTAEEIVEAIEAGATDSRLFKLQDLPGFVDFKEQGHRAFRSSSLLDRRLAYLRSLRRAVDLSRPEP